MGHAKLPDIKKWVLVENYRDFIDAGDDRKWKEKPSDEEEKSWRKAYNTCENCGPDTKAVRRDFGNCYPEADLWCANCDSLIREMDFG